MRVRMPKIPENFAPQELPAIQETAPEQQIITTEVLIAPPPTNNQSESAIPSTSAPAAALSQVQTPGRRWVEKPLPHSFEPRFESRRPDAAKRRLALGVGTQSRQDPTESRAADQG